MPSSYEGKWGKVTYSLRAKLTQSIWLVHKAKTDFPLRTKSEFPFASQTEMMIIGLKVWTLIFSQTYIRFLENNVKCYIFECHL